MKIFKTFFMGGYECADHINRSGKRINLLKETQHDLRVDEDYKALCTIGIKTVREGICWSSVENDDGTFDFTEVRNRMETAEKFGIQQIWDLIHFGYPDGLFPTHPLFCERFENYALHSPYSMKRIRDSSFLLCQSMKSVSCHGIPAMCAVPCPLQSIRDGTSNIIYAKQLYWASICSEIFSQIAGYF